MAGDEQSKIGSGLPLPIPQQHAVGTSGLKTRPEEYSKLRSWRLRAFGSGCRLRPAGRSIDRGWSVAEEAMAVHSSAVRDSESVGGECVQTNCLGAKRGRAGAL